ncbi:MAG: hypothetical protein AVDCRST_MAG36-1964 [uncultured Nocardioidaceae bacterium]|uniref:Uncharacterized protein n=1 Tax=uncultured Nocardioidaceae bacterium TaxID=253824 RepID=A0A6J4M5K0_9ACTN|nr:MAG: hypothetical protein AVDCRST_MAG36-1964 [uncultured Nocardioidaceae bacterium]
MSAGQRATDGDASGDDQVQALRRWEASGAVWRVLRRGGGTVTVALLTCDGGEQVGEARCDEDAVAAFLAGRSTNAD